MGIMMPTQQAKRVGKIYSPFRSVVTPHSGTVLAFDYDLHCRTWACLLCSLSLCHHPLHWLRLLTRAFSLSIVSAE